MTNLNGNPDYADVQKRAEDDKVTKLAMAQAKEVCLAVERVLGKGPSSKL